MIESVKQIDTTAHYAPTQLVSPISMALSVDLQMEVLRMSPFSASAV